MTNPAQPPKRAHQWEPTTVFFFCPGCKNNHGVTVNGNKNSGVAGWAWNGSLERPTFTPSLLCNPQDKESRCHSFITDGRIQFLPDCFHALAGKTVDLPDWED